MAALRGNSLRMPVNLLDTADLRQRNLHKTTGVETRGPQDAWRRTQNADYLRGTQDAPSHVFGSSACTWESSGGVSV